MGFGEAIGSCLRSYARFSGRAGRGEYWWFQLFYAAGYVLLLVLASLVDGAAPYVLLLVFVLGMVLPLLAAGVRRLHDTGRSGLWLLLSVVPLGGLVVLYFLLQRSDPGANSHGPHPLA